MHQPTALSFPYRLYDIADELQDRNENVSEYQREEVDRIIETFRQKAKNAWNVVMSQELTLVSQTEQVLGTDHLKVN